MSILLRLREKLRKISFALFHAPSFAVCGENTLMRGPFRVDGAEFISLGSRTVFQEGGWLYCAPEGGNGRLAIGSGCVFGYNNHITAVKDVLVEDNVLTANNVYVSDNVHAYEDISTPIMQQPVRFKNRVVIGRGSWIGENACIIGASIGRNCVIGANSVVTRDIPDYSVAVGAPAQVIRRHDPASGKWVNP